jgi:hypothetical protein
MPITSETAMKPDANNAYFTMRRKNAARVANGSWRRSNIGSILVRLQFTQNLIQIQRTDCIQGDFQCPFVTQAIDGSALIALLHGLQTGRADGLG